MPSPLPAAINLWLKAAKLIKKKSRQGSGTWLKKNQNQATQFLYCLLNISILGFCILEVRFGEMDSLVKYGPGDS